MNKVEIVENYKKYISEIPEMIAKSPYKTQYFIDKLKMHKVTFYRKLKNRRFSLEEVSTITEVLNPKDFYLLELNKELEKGRNDIAEGRVHEHADVMNKAMETVKNYYQ